MPFASKAQQRWAHSPAGLKALGGASAVHEWDEATQHAKGGFRSLPERAKQAEADFQWALAKVAELAGSNVLKTFTGSSALPTPPKPATATRMNPMQGVGGGLGAGRRGVLGGGLGSGVAPPAAPSAPAVPTITRPATPGASRQGVLDALTQTTVQAPQASTGDGATLPARF